jgi:predicted DNA-binding protein
MAKKITTTIRIEPELKERLQQRVGRNRKSAMISVLIKKYLDENLPESSANGQEIK